SSTQQLLSSRAVPLLHSEHTPFCRVPFPTSEREALGRRPLLQPLRQLSSRSSEVRVRSRAGSPASAPVHDPALSAPSRRRCECVHSSRSLRPEPSRYGRRVTAVAKIPPAS